MILARVAAGAGTGAARRARVDERRARHRRSAERARALRAASTACTSRASSSSTTRPPTTCASTASRRPHTRAISPFSATSTATWRRSPHDLATRAAAGLTAIFSHCEGFSESTDLGAWMCANAQAPAANYVNTVGRTVRATHENAALHDALAGYADGQSRLADATPLEVHRQLRAFALGEVAAGRLALTPEAPTPLEWSVRSAVHAVGVPLVLLILAVPLVLVGIVFWVRIRMLEESDPVYCPRAARRARRAVGVARRPRRHQSVQRDGLLQARSWSGAGRRSFSSGSSTGPRATSTRADTSRASRRSTSRAGSTSTTRTGCCSRATTTAASTATWTTSSTRWRSA